MLRFINGQTHETAADNGLREYAVYLDAHTATGTVGQNPVAVAVLIFDTGKGEIYYDLALLKKTALGWHHADTIELGDRVRIQSVSIENEEIVVNLKIHGPYDRECCSTLETVYQYAVVNDRLIKKPGPVEYEIAPAFEGTLWKWRETYYYKNDTHVQSYDPNAYSIHIVPRKKLEIRADCNVIQGDYAVDGEYINFEIPDKPLVSCGPESLGETFLGDLKSAFRYFFKNKNLYIVLKDNAGIMVFQD